MRRCSLTVLLVLLSTVTFVNAETQSGLLRIDCGGAVDAEIWLDATSLGFCQQSPRTFKVPSGSYGLRIVISSRQGSPMKVMAFVIQVESPHAFYFHLPSASDDESHEAVIETETRFFRGEDWLQDRRTGLIWQDSSDNESLRMSIQDARQYCLTLEVETLTDWRLPTKIELLGIVDDALGTPLFDVFRHQFSFAGYNYVWSASNEYINSVAVWKKYFKDGYSDENLLSQESYVRCVHQTP